MPEVRVVLGLVVLLSLAAWLAVWLWTRGWRSEARRYPPEGDSEVPPPL